jgi:hypothetical protein
LGNQVGPSLWEFGERLDKCMGPPDGADPGHGYSCLSCERWEDSQGQGRLAFPCIIELDNAESRASGWAASVIPESCQPVSFLKSP